eukprot:IDg9557t1
MRQQDSFKGGKNRQNKKEKVRNYFRRADRDPAEPSDDSPQSEPSELDSDSDFFPSISGSDSSDCPRNIHQAVEELRQTRHKVDKEDMVYFIRFEEAHARCGEYLPEAQLISAYNEAVDLRICPILREARDNKKRITLLELCRKAAN